VIQAYIRALAVPVVWEWRLGRALRSLSWFASCGCCSRRRRAEVGVGHVALPNSVNFHCRLINNDAYVMHPCTVQRAAWQSPAAAQTSLELWLDVCRRLTRVLSLLYESEGEVNTSDVARALVFQCSPALWSVLVSAHTLVAHVSLCSIDGSMVATCKFHS
jgi:hypothetical protein